MSNPDANLTKLKALLTKERADYTIYQDSFNLESAEAGAKHYGIALSETTPTIILKSKDKYFAAIICGDTRISFKKLKQVLNIKDISMANPETVLSITGAKVGEVSLINDEMDTIIDSNVVNNINCYGGSGVHKTTLRINTNDLIRITNAKLLDFTERR